MGCIGHTVPVYDNKGTLTTPAQTGFDVRAYKIDLNLAPDDKGDAAQALKGGKLATGMPSGASLDYYVKFDGAAGWLALDTFTMGFLAESSFTSGSTGASVGKPVPDTVELGLGLNGELTTLFTKLAEGKSLKSIEVEAYAQGSKGPVLVDEYRFTDTFITDLDSANASDNTVGFVYKSFTHGHIDFDSKGSPLPFNGVGLDIATLTTVTVPTPSADVFG